jgi:hypothetical protein
MHTVTEIANAKINLFLDVTAHPYIRFMVRNSARVFVVYLLYEPRYEG